MPEMEMAPNLPNSTDDRPRPGRLSEATADEIRPNVAAWTLLNAYIALTVDLGTLDPGEAVPTGLGGDSALRDAIRHGLRELHPAMVAGHADDARKVMTWIRPRWRQKVVVRLFAEAATWLAASGYQPEQRTWFRGAVSYLRAMVPARHAEQAEQLLDYEALAAEHVYVRRLPGGHDTTLFGLDRLEHTVWYSAAMRAHPVAAIHAAAALAAWVYAEPGAVRDPGEVAVELAKRALEYGQLAPPLDPSAVRGPVPGRDVGDVFIPPWRQPPPPGAPSAMQRILAALDAEDNEAYADVILEVGAAGIQTIAAEIAQWATWVYAARSGADVIASLDPPDRGTPWADHLARIVDADTSATTMVAAEHAVRELPDQPDLWALIWHLAQALRQMVTACGGLPRLGPIHQLHTQVPAGSCDTDLQLHSIVTLAALSTGQHHEAAAYLQRTITLHGAAGSASGLLTWWMQIAAGLKAGSGGGYVITTEFIPGGLPVEDDVATPAAHQHTSQVLADFLTAVRSRDGRQVHQVMSDRREQARDLGMPRLLWTMGTTLGHHINHILARSADE